MLNIRGKKEAGDESEGKARRRVRGERASSKSHGWQLKSVVNHVTFSGSGGERMIAWYLLDPQQWSFRSIDEGESLISAQAATLSELQGTTVHVRVTSRPYPVRQWAKTAYSNAPEAQSGFDELMERDQRHMASSAQSDKLVYYGVDLGERSFSVRQLARVSATAIDREMQALQERLDTIDALMAGSGVEARPAKPAEMEWLIARGLALGCPVPVPDVDAPTSGTLDEDDVTAFAAGVEWDVAPLDPCVRVTTSYGGRQITRYVIVLTVGRMADVDIPRSYQPWMSKTDALRFPVEWMGRVEVRTPEEVSREMTKLAQRIDSQMSHWRDDHGKRPPKQLARQAARSGDVEDEMRTGFTGMATRVRAWYRCAVSGGSPEEALERAQRVQALYRPQIQLARELGQYHLAREFVPGEPLSSTAHSRKQPLLKFAAGLPAITSEVGDKRGPHIGETTGLSARAVCHDPWYLTEVMETGGLIPIVGTPGCGKSMLMAALSYKHVQAGVCGAAMDPAGRMQKMLNLPAMQGISRSVDLLGGEPGSLNPYAVVPEPRAEYVRLDCSDPSDPDELAERLERASRNAAAARRDLASYVARWCLPLALNRDDAVQELLRDAVASCRSDARGSLSDVAAWLHSKGGDLGERVSRQLRDAAERELGQLFFPAHGKVRDDDVLDDYEHIRFTVFNLKGLQQPGQEIPIEDWSADEMLVRPIMTLASWSCLNLIYRRDPHERKLFSLDEAQEVTEGSSAGRAFVYKISTDSRKNNNVAYVSTQNASNVLGERSINNFAGACFVGRTADEDAQRDALKLLGKPEGHGYEALLGNLSRRRRDGEELPYREFIYRDGLGGEGGRGGMERIRVSVKHHPELFEALNTTADPRKRLRAVESEAS